MTRREVLIAREVYCGAILGGLTYCGATPLRDQVRAIAAGKFALPVTARPRVVAVEDQTGLSMRKADGAYEFCYDGGPYWRPISDDGAGYRGPHLTLGMLAALRSLDAEPSETVTEDET